MTASEDLVAAVAAYGLPGATATFPAALDDQTWEQLRVLARAHRMAGFAVAAIVDGALAVTETQATSMGDEHAASMGTALRLESLLLEAVDLLDRNGIDSRVFKGSALAHTIYPDPSWRSFGDVDLLVPSERFGDVINLLEQIGLRRMYGELRPGFDRRFGKTATLARDDGMQIDLHRTLVDGRFGLTIDLDELFADPIVYELGDRPVKTLGREQRFLSVCYHVAVGDRSPRMVPMRDVAQMLLCTEMDYDRLDRLIASWRCEPVVVRAVLNARRALKLASSHPMLERAQAFVPSRSDRRAIAAYTSESSAIRRALLGAASMKGLRAKAAYLGAFVAPRRESIPDRHDGSYLRWWLHGARSMLRRGAR